MSNQVLSEYFRFQRFHWHRAPVLSLYRHVLRAALRLGRPSPRRHPLGRIASDLHDRPVDSSVPHEWQWDECALRRDFLLAQARTAFRHYPNRFHGNLTRTDVFLQCWADWTRRLRAAAEGDQRELALLDEMLWARARTPYEWARGTADLMAVMQELKRHPRPFLRPEFDDIRGEIDKGWDKRREYRYPLPAHLRALLPQRTPSKRRARSGWTPLASRQWFKTANGYMFWRPRGRRQPHKLSMRIKKLNLSLLRRTDKQNWLAKRLHEGRLECSLEKRLGIQPDQAFVNDLQIRYSALKDWFDQLSKSRDRITEFAHNFRCKKKQEHIRRWGMPRHRHPRWMQIMRRDIRRDLNRVYKLDKTAVGERVRKLEEEESASTNPGGWTFGPAGDDWYAREKELQKAIKMAAAEVFGRPTTSCRSSTAR